MIPSLQTLFDPKSIAVIGASDNPNKVGGRPIHYMRKFGYRGKIFPINPGRSEVQGIPAFESVETIGEVPDTAIIAVESKSVLEQVGRCGKLGVKTAVIMASGFGELGEEGKAAQAELVSKARAHGMRLVGPNAQGIANFSNGAILNFSTMFMEIEPLDGPIAVVSQSGAASVMPYALLRKAGYGVRYIAATGNDADIGACAITEEIARDGSIKLILVYLESISDPARLAAAARLAKQRGAYIVVLKSGGSRLGAIAASSHTGAVVGDDVAVDAFLRRHGIWRAHDMGDFIRATPLYLQDHPIGSGKTVVMSHSGAVSVMIADIAERIAMPLSDLSASTKTRLSEALPAFATPNNPLDMTAGILGNPGIFPRVLTAIGADDQADMVVIGVPVAGPGFDVAGMAEATAQFEREHSKPLIVCAPQDHVRQYFLDKGLPSYVTENEGIWALHQYASHRKLRDSIHLKSDPAALGKLALSGVQDEDRSLQLLNDAGVTSVRYRVCNSVEEAKAAFATFDGEVVVKGCATEVLHKSEHKLVHVGLSTPREVAEATEKSLLKLASLGVSSPRVIVAQMVRGGHEFALGVKVDPVLGPIVLIGEGGTLLEIRKDIAVLAAPFDINLARTACLSLRISPVFDGYRNAPPLDLEALAQAAVALGDFAAAAKDQLVSIDINPVMVMPRGGGAIAVDAVVELSQAPHGEMPHA